MKILQKFEYTWPEGTEQIEMYDWLKTFHKRNKMNLLKANAMARDSDR